MHSDAEQQQQKKQFTQHKSEAVQGLRLLHLLMLMFPFYFLYKNPVTSCDDEYRYIACIIHIIMKRLSMHFKIIPESEGERSNKIKFYCCAYAHKYLHKLQ